jgi:hypothetical protein
MEADLVADDMVGDRMVLDPLPDRLSGTAKSSTRSLIFISTDEPFSARGDSSEAREKYAILKHIPAEESNAPPAAV